MDEIELSHDGWLKHQIKGIASLPIGNKTIGIALDVYAKCFKLCKPKIVQSQRLTSKTETGSDRRQ